MPKARPECLARRRGSPPYEPDAPARGDHRKPSPARRVGVELLRTANMMRSRSDPQGGPAAVGSAVASPPRQGEGGRPARARPGYGWRGLAGDAAGGAIAALVALPYGLALARLMGLPAELGLLTSILTAPITALLG